ncbi:IMPACT family protein [Bacteroidota bacterium]
MNLFFFALEYDQKMFNETYKTIKDPSEGLYKEKGSKFLSFAYPLNNEEEFKIIKTNIGQKFHDARHRCYAYRIGYDKAIYRSNDDGEPSNTAGKPILGQIKSFDLTNILIYVVRYFGGTLLGVGGLINAYKLSANDAIKNAIIIEKTIKDTYRIDFKYNSMNLIMRILKENNIQQFNQVFEMNCSLCFSIKKSDKEKILDKFNKIDDIELQYLYTN